MEKLNLKRVLKTNTPEEVAKIVKHRDRMIALEKLYSGEEKWFIQMEIFDCRRFIRNAYKRSAADKRRLERKLKKG